MGAFDFLNKISDIFKTNKIRTNEVATQKNSIGLSQEEYDKQNSYGQLGNPGDMFTSMVSFYDYFQTKRERISFYKTMSMFSEISDALDNICDDAVIDNGDGKICYLELNKEYIPEAIQNAIRKEFDKVISNVFSFRDRGWDFFRKWLVESELFLEVVLNSSKTRVIGVKVLPAHTMYPIYEGNIITKYIQTKVDTFISNVGINPNDVVEFEPNQILYINFGVYGKNLMDVRGYLEPSIRPYNMLRSIEDSIVVYRLVRAPERRIFNIDVGNLPKGKAEAYIKELIQKYKKKLNYDTATGGVQASQHIQSMIEDFWFAKTAAGGSSVETLQSGMNLGEINDLTYFLKKLYKSLKLPKSRWEENVNYSAGKMGEIQREEVKFSNFITRLRNRFEKMFIDALCLQLKITNQIDSQYIRPEYMNVSWVENNLYKQYKDRESATEMLDIWKSVADSVVTKKNLDAPFSREFVFRNMMGMNQDQWAENERLRKEESVNLKIKDIKSNDEKGLNTENPPEKTSSEPVPENPPPEEETPTETPTEPEATTA